MWSLAGAILAAIAYWDRPTRAVIRPEDIAAATVPPRLDGTHPCVFASLAADGAPPALGQCATPVEHSVAVDRVEVDLRYGSFVLRQTDLLLNDVFAVPFTRTYTSWDWADRRPQAFGLNTAHPYDSAPAGSRFPYTYLMLDLEDEDFLYFPRIPAGTGFADAVYLHTGTSTRFYKATIAWNGDGWTLHLVDGSEMRFPEAYNAKNRAQGAAYELRDAAGDKLLLQRDDQRTLKEIHTPHGHWIRLQHDDQARIVHAEDDGGNSVRYDYNGEGMLQSAVSSSGTARYYQYSGKLMTAILDEHSRFLLHNWYSSGRLIRQQFANGDTWSYEYTFNPRGYAVVTAVVTLPDHSEKVIKPADSVPNYVLNY